MLGAAARGAGVCELRIRSLELGELWQARFSAGAMS